MEEQNNNEGQVTEQEAPNLQALEGVEQIQVDQIADQIKAGDDALNKLKVQNLDFILDIPLKVTVELGRTTVIIKDLLQLGQGSVLELDKLAGEPLEILVNGKLVAKGEVVVVNEKFGIRLTDIISPVERIETLK
jgi:flagellar motor switch protein FliN/FliY